MDLVCAILSVGCFSIFIPSSFLSFILGVRHSSVVRVFANGAMDQSFIVDPLISFSFQPVLHDWFNKGCGMYYPVCRMVHINDPLLLIGKSSPCSGGSRFPLAI